MDHHGIMDLKTLVDGAESMAFLALELHLPRSCVLICSELRDHTGI